MISSDSFYDFWKVTNHLLIRDHGTKLLMIALEIYNNARDLNHIM